MKRSGYADLPLHYGTVPPWLSLRMAKLGGSIIESIVNNYGTGEVLRRLSDPLWFQCLGAVLGMDWHSSGITTSVMGALKKAISPISHELGLFICGGRGKHSRNTPHELMEISMKTGLDGDLLVSCSRLSAKVDSTAIQDGYQIYLHSFIVSESGEWVVVQQGMNDNTGLARRYHWHSKDVQSFTNEPHASIYGQNAGIIINMVDHRAAPARKSVVELTRNNPEHLLREIRSITMPRMHEVRSVDVDLKRLGSVLAVAYDTEIRDFESLLLLKGLGPRTMQSLALVSEVIHGTPARFMDPARFSFAHGGKDGHPAPVPLKVYDETIEFMKNTMHHAKLGFNDRNRAIKSLMTLRQNIEKYNNPRAHFENLINKERSEASLYGGRTVFDNKRKYFTGQETVPENDKQLYLF